MRVVKLLVLIFALACFPAISQAASTPDATLAVKISLQKNGLVQVQENISFQSVATFNWKINSKYSDLKLTSGSQTVDYEAKKSGETTTISSTKRNTIWTLEYLATDSIIRHNDRDQLFMKVFQEPNTTFRNVTVDFYLPDKAVPGNFASNLYAIGGVSEIKKSDNASSAASYSLDSAGAKSILTFSSSWDSDYLSLGAYEGLRLGLMNLELLPWLVLGGALPLLGLLTLIHLLIKRKQITRRTTEELSEPPEKLSPMLVGVLVNKKIYENEIVATLVDLCQRGYLIIVHKSNDFLLSKRRPLDTSLADWEQKFLEQLFATKSGKVTEENLTDLSRESLYNPEIRQAFDRVYELVSERKSFTENPHLTRMRYKFFALLLYFFGLIAAIWVVIQDKTPALLFPIAGTMILAWFIIRLSPQLSSYSQDGLKKYEQWLKFANFLKKPEPYNINSATDQTFERYLAYAIALGVAKEWADRFESSNRSTVRPDWFLSYQDQSKSQFVDDITKFTKSISEIIGKLRGPLVS